MGSRKKKDRRKAKRTAAQRGASRPFAMKGNNGGQLRPEKFTVTNELGISLMLNNGFEWGSYPEGALSGIKVDGRPYELPLDALVDGRPHHLVLFHEELVDPDMVGIGRALGVLIENPDDPEDMYLILPGLVPSILVPAEHRDGKLTTFHSPAFSARAANFARKLPKGSGYSLVINADDWWWDATGSAWEHAVSLAYSSHLDALGAA